MDFGQVITAMVTPFNHKGNVDFDMTGKLINHLLGTGTDALVIAGTTGESPTLTNEEKVALFKYVVKTVNGKVPVIAGTGNNSTKSSVELTKRAQEIGVDGIMAVTPYYNKPSQAGMLAHFEAIAKATTLPVMIYNIPGRSVVNITVDTMIELSKIENITSVKEASGDLEQMAMIIEKTDDSFVLYSGDDQLTLPALAVGAKGIVSVSSHVIGKEMQKMIEDFLKGEHERAAKWHRKLLPFMKAMFVAPNPVPLKTALRLKGIDVGGVRLPLISLSEAERQLVVEQFHALQK